MSKNLAVPQAAWPQYLDLERCPHCGINRPNLRKDYGLVTASVDLRNSQYWAIYVCERCGGTILAYSQHTWITIGSIHYWPQGRVVLDESIPPRAARFLQEALDTRHAPNSSVIICSSSVDAMLKAKGYKDGSLYARIEQAISNHLITKEMGQWAHAVRLDANDQRHADETAELATQADADRCIEFAFALAQFLFVLPAMVNKGLKVATGETVEPEELEKPDEPLVPPDVHVANPGYQAKPIDEPDR